MQDHTAALIDRLIQFLIAFVLPGGVVLFACAIGSETVRTWFAGAQSGPTLVGFAFVMLAALAIGWVVSAVRYCLFERIRLGGRCLVPAPLAVDESKRAQQAQVYADLRRAYYDHYLATSNLAVAVPVGVTIGAMSAPSALRWWQWGGVAVATILVAVALATAACSAIERYETRRRSFGPAAAA